MTKSSAEATEEARGSAAAPCSGGPEGAPPAPGGPAGHPPGDAGFSTAELLGNAALGIAALIAIWAVLQALLP